MISGFPKNNLDEKTVHLVPCVEGGTDVESLIKRVKKEFEK